MNSSLPMIDTSDKNAARVIYDGREFNFVHSDPDDHLLAVMRNSGAFYEAELLSLLEPLVPRAASVIDIGANIGNHSVFFAGVMGCRVIAFEPNPVAAALLTRNLYLNGVADKVEIRKCAIGADRRRGQITGGGGHNLGTAAVEATPDGSIEIVPLDALDIDGDVALIKVDVEGGEYDVLSGAMSFLKTHKPILVLEISLAKNYRRIAELLQPLGYVAAGSYNFTPTHIFRVPAKGERAANQLAEMGHRLSLHYIDAMKRTAGIDSRLTTLRKQIGQLAEVDKTVAERLDATAREHGQDIKAIARVEALLEELKAHAAAQAKALSDQEVKTTQQMAALEGSLRDLALSLGGMMPFVPELHALSERVASQQAESAARDARLGNVLSGFAERLEALGSITAGVAALAARFDRIEPQLATAADEVSDMRKAARDQFGVMLELQALASADLDAKLTRLDARTRATVRRVLEERLPTRLKQGFSELAMQLTQAIGVAMAERELADDIVASTEEFDIWKAMAVLGVSEGSAGQAASVPARTDMALVAKEVATETPRADTSANARKVWYVKERPKDTSRFDDEAVEPVDLHRADAPASQVLFAKAVSLSKQVSEVLVTLDLEETWDRSGWRQGGAVLEPRGRVIAKTACPRLSFVGPTINCAGGGLIEVEVELGDLDHAHGVPVLRLQTEASFPIGQDWPLQNGTTTVLLFAPHHTKQLKFYVLLADAPAGASFQVKRISIHRLDAETHWRTLRLTRSERVLASMASIPSRREALRDSVNSLLLQCDKVRVFLNNYPDVPDFLVHPRIEVRRSQDWDDRGDAGKFFWIDKDRSENGFRLIVDDDLIFPPDFAEVMTAKAGEFDKRAIISMHGILLRQPIDRFYDRASRAITFHFEHPIDRDRFVHIGGTGVMCFHSSAVDMGWDDFKYCNSGDLWIGLYAQRNGLPMVTPARRRNWIVENRKDPSDPTIYDQSFQRSRTRFDSSQVQDAVLRHAWPLTVKTTDRPKLGLAIRLLSLGGAAVSVAHWVARAASCGSSAEIVFLLIYDGQDAALWEAAAGLTLPYETHLITTMPAGGLSAELDAMRSRLDLDALLVVDETVQSQAPVAWADRNAELVNGVPLRRSQTGVSLVWSAHRGKHCLAFALLPDERGREGLSALLRGDELVAIGLPPKQARAGFALADIPDGKPRLGPDELRKEHAPKGLKKSPVTVNEVFKRVVVLNLDRRRDRLMKVMQRLSRAGIVAERFSAVDGQDPAVAAEFAAYDAEPLRNVSPEMPPIADWRDFYMSDVSQTSRIAHFEEKSGRKAIASAGAWGYLRSYEAILERSLEQQDETLLVFDDDVALHRDFGRLFDEAVAQLPDDWLIVQLGTLQHNWNEPWAEWRTPLLYQTNGSAIGSHAVGMRFDILPFLLDHTKRMDMPYDIGALSAATRAFPDRCFVIYPNLAIQALDGSDIGTSVFQKARTIEEVAATHRWHLDDYILPARPRRAKW